FRVIYIVSELLFIILTLLFLLRDVGSLWLGDVLLGLLLSTPWLIPTVVGIASLLFGIKINYSCRVACGDYIDTKVGIERFISFLFSGVLIGMVLAGLLHTFGLPLSVLALVPLMLLPSTFMINLPYNPETQYAKVDKEDEEDRKSALSMKEAPRKETSFFTYMNFLYIIIYGYFGSVVISRFYGELVYVKLAFISLLIIILLIGFGAGRFMALSRIHVYGQAFLPVTFLIFLLLVMSYGRSLHFIGGMLLFVPTAFLLGVLLYRSVRTVGAQYDSGKRASIFEFAAFILPPPAIISLSLLDFRNLWFYIVISIIMLMCVVLPAISMINSAIGGLKKAAYFFFSLLFIPLLIFIMLYFNIPLDNGVYVTRVEKFEVLQSINYNADYIRAHATIMMNQMPVFKITDSVVRNYRRALVPIVLYHRDDESLLFVDGNQRFFRNPVIGYFKNAVCLDELSDRDVDFYKLPYSGSQKYVPDNDSLLLYLGRTGKSYHTIVDMPNLLDQSLNSFRFSAGYYETVKKILAKNGIFVQLFNVPECRPELLSAAVTNIQKTFSYHQVYYFSNILVIMSSNASGAFAVNQESYARLSGLFASHEELGVLFENEAHLLSHMLSAGPEALRPDLSRGAFLPGMALPGQDRLNFRRQIIDGYLTNNRSVFTRLETEVDPAFVQVLGLSFQNADAVLTLLKKIELAEARENYPEETGFLFELKKQAEFNISLQNYVRKMLAYKEKYYYYAAVQMEKERQWTGAQELYRSVLAINPDNFEANYRMGLLSITLQDIEGSFKYLNEAMRINGDHPKVLFQVGILYFSSGKTEDAISYFDRALQKNEKLPSIYRYLGLCHEKLGNLYEAEKYYAKSINTEPNDVETKARLSDVRSRIEKENRKWEMPEQKNEAEVEQDADMPLPVSKGAYDVRLKDNDETLPVIDPITGEEIQTDGTTGDTKGSVQPRAEQLQSGPVNQK
ncbi:MAG TPA: tetratricopeptide repeat protein, partial [Spirochaetota bacterium]|nr:tetratricopeptide repeat protein [Spirochaetota bacterium]